MTSRTVVVILVTRLNGPPFAINPDLLERVESTPDTVLTLIDGTKFLVAETVGDVIELVRDYRASVVATARDLSSVEDVAPAQHDPAAHPQHGDHAVPGARSSAHAHEPHPHLAAVPTLPQEV